MKVNYVYIIYKEYTEHKFYKPPLSLKTKCKVLSF